MKTKRLLIGAALLAAGLATSLADTLYQTFVPGYNLCVPLLKAADNSAETYLPCLQSGDEILIWNGSGYDYDYFNGPGDWYDGTTFNPINTPTLSMGQGFFYQNNQGSPEINTYTGTRLTGGSEPIPLGYTLIGSYIPIADYADSSSFNLPLQSGDELVIWNGSGFDYDYFNAPGDWYDATTFSSISTPVLGIGQGFFYVNNNTSTTWNQ